MRLSPQQKGAHHSAVQGVHSDTRTALHITIPAVKEKGRKIKEKSHAFTTEVSTFTPRTYIGPVFQISKAQLKVFLLLLLLASRIDLTFWSCKHTSHLSAGGSEDPLQGFFPCHPHSIQQQPCCKRLSLKQTKNSKSKHSSQCTASTSIHSI